MTAVEVNADNEDISEIVYLRTIPASVTTISPVLHLVTVQSTNDTNRLLHSLYIG